MSLMTITLINLICKNNMRSLIINGRLPGEVSCGKVLLSREITSRASLDVVTKIKLRCHSSRLHGVIS